MNRAQPTDLRVDHELYLAATRVLGELETGEEPFDIHTGADRYLADLEVQQWFDGIAGQPLRSARHVARAFVGAVLYPGHYNQPFERYVGDIQDLDELVADAVRTMMWTFLTAWTQRYGGVSKDMTARSPVVVDPGTRNPQI